ncbi:hypothetical protein EN20_06585 [Mycobacterium tuberculosis]|nr:hypothetical protein EN20_06585 [Mycobacterium tuberculosis]
MLPPGLTATPCGSLKLAWVMVVTAPAAPPAPPTPPVPPRSLLRQLGWHTLARGWDGRALALAGADREAGADALIGLAADALGVGRFAAAGHC